MSQQDGQNETCNTVVHQRSNLPPSTVNGSISILEKDRKGFEKIPLKSFWDLKTSETKILRKPSTPKRHIFKHKK